MDLGPPLLSVQGMTKFYGRLVGCRDVGFDLWPGEVLCVVGESGSGKSVTAKTLMNLLPSYARVEGSVMFDGRDVRELAAQKEKHFWGVEMTMIFQDPMTSLNPVKKVGEQIAESLRVHLGRSRKEARDEAGDDGDA